MYCLTVSSAELCFMNDEKKTTDDKLELIKEIGSLSGDITLNYVQKVKVLSCNPDDDSFAVLSDHMDKVIKIDKFYADRLLLAEGKNTSNIGIDGKGGMPFKLVINKHYPAKEVDSKEVGSVDLDNDDTVLGLDTSDITGGEDI